MSKKVVIVGSEGQDGKILFELLNKEGSQVIGIDREAVRTSNADWQKKLNISDRASVSRLLQVFQPDEVYYFAAFHHSSQDVLLPEAELIEQSYQVHVFSYLHFLEGVRLYSPKTRIFYAASSLIFGDTESEMQDEGTPYRPNSAYGITKLDGLFLSRLYREKYGVFASVGIFYNHESEYRSEKFVSMKVVTGAINIQSGKQEELIVGDLSTEVDWGYAGDYMEAARRILELGHSGEFIIATGEKHSLKELVDIVFGIVGLNPKELVKEDQSLLTRRRKPMIGDITKLHEATGWKPRTSFREMIEKMVASKQ
jgi:GDPmannose 4,6-dehydratase